jgi:lysozyme
MKINLLVIDLSHFDFATDYAKVKASGVAGVIYKATQGSGMNDSTYLAQKAEAKAAGLLWGAYHFGDGSDPKDQAQNFLTFARVDPDELFCLDYEDYPSSQMSIGQAETFVVDVEAGLGRNGQCVLYSGNLIKETIRSQDQGFWSARRLWLAEYGPTPKVPAPWAKQWLWQYTDGESGPTPHGVPGVSEKTHDCNHYDGTPEQLAAEWATGKASTAPVVRYCPTCHQKLP